MPTPTRWSTGRVSNNERFSSLVASEVGHGQLAAAHSVHIVAGGLAPDAEYYYRFRAQGCRWPTTGAGMPSHKTDPDLQAAHAIAPWLVVPDDHEVENNYAGMVGRNNTPALTDRTVDGPAHGRLPGVLRRACRCARRLLPSGNGIPAVPTRCAGAGGLATFRGHASTRAGSRDDQACGDGRKVCADADLPSRSLPRALPKRPGRLDAGSSQHHGHSGTSLDGRSSSLANSDAAGAAQYGRLRTRLPREPGAHPAGAGPIARYATRAVLTGKTSTGPGPKQPRADRLRQPPHRRRSAPNWSAPQSPLMATGRAATIPNARRPTRI